MKTFQELHDTDKHKKINSAFQRIFQVGMCDRIPQGWDEAQMKYTHSDTFVFLRLRAAFGWYTLVSFNLTQNEVRFGQRELEPKGQKKIIAFAEKHGIKLA